MRILFSGFSLLLFVFQTISVTAQVNPTGFIHVDQFGYQPEDEKVAVISDPHVGFNSGDSFQPGSVYELRSWPSNTVVFSGAPSIWNNGAIHSGSGDKGWWFDFSSVKQAGEYYVFDVQNQVSSSLFRIDEHVYQEVLEQAVRVFFYQRINFAKSSPYVDQAWVDGAAFEGADQDRFATSRWSKGDPSTVLDLHGGWMDAGDYNKYTTFAREAVLHLLQAYDQAPDVFTDATGIPESGNGIPDLIDEIMWELDWLKRMQDGTGTNGFLLKLGADNYNTASPPSTDTNPRYYLPECTSATLSGAAIFAYAGEVLRKIPALQSYAADLTNRAKLAWARADVTTQGFTTFETDCDDGDIKAGDADMDAAVQLETAFIASVYLLASTGEQQFLTFAETNYSQVKPFSENWWGPYSTASAAAMMYLTTLPGVSSSVSSAIQNSKSGMNYQYSVDDYQNGTDLYRGFLEEWAHHWGSNQIRATAGNQNLEFIAYNVNPSQEATYRKAAFGYLHWLHGVNPMDICMLSNMYEHGGDNCANEIYHAWFDDGTDWDHAQNSLHGPPPGFLTGGPNFYFSEAASVSPPGNQPPSKSYKDWNTGWPESSWEVTEPAIYYQAAYVLLLSRLMTQSVSATSITEREVGSSMQLSPNPCKDVVHVDLPEPSTAEDQILIFDLQGRMVRRYAPVLSAQRQTVDLSELPQGMYILRYASPHTRYSGKMLVKRD